MLAALLFICTGCPSVDPTPEPTDTFKITGVSLPATLQVTYGSSYTLMAKGFQTGDFLKFVASADTSKFYQVNLTSVAETSVTFDFPSEMTSGSYHLYACRGSKRISLGNVSVTITADVSVPDKEGMTVKGIVYCDGKGLSGVPVSDGVEVTTTDAKGIYYLPSAKKYGYVFITIPKNYEPTITACIPQFFKELQYGAGVTEQCDFELFKTDNSKYMLIAMADIHLANRNNDISQFQTDFLNEVSAKISARKASGLKTYILTLGDETWDIYWYEKNFRLPNWLNTIGSVGAPVFNIMGNHDNDPYCADDLAASAPFRQYVGPSYYSFNLGDCHYVVLDDIVYVNTGGSQGTVGKRNYEAQVTNDQIAWMQKDLALVADKSTPIFVAMHIQMHNTPHSLSNGEQVTSYRVSNASKLLSITNSFSNVQYLTGHTHTNSFFNCSTTDAAVTNNTIERNIAGVCATWWWTGALVGNHICTDGSQGGYGVFDVDGTSIHYHYKSMLYDDDYQFRAYDLNTVSITAAKFAPNASQNYKDMVATYAGDYASAGSSNEVLINVFNYERGASLKVTENGTELTVTRVVAKDPLHIISYECPRLNSNTEPTDGFDSDAAVHMFKCRASSANSTLTITLTEPNGDVFTQTMTRPKDFSLTMK